MAEVEAVNGGMDVSVYRFEGAAAAAAFACWQFNCITFPLKFVSFILQLFGPLTYKVLVKKKGLKPPY